MHISLQPTQRSTDAGTCESQPPKPPTEQRTACAREPAATEHTAREGDPRVPCVPIVSFKTFIAGNVFFPGDHVEFAPCECRSWNGLQSGSRLEYRGPRVQRHPSCHTTRLDDDSRSPKPWGRYGSTRSTKTVEVASAGRTPGSGRRHHSSCDGQGRAGD